MITAGAVCAPLAPAWCSGLRCGGRLWCALATLVSGLVLVAFKPPCFRAALPTGFATLTLACVRVRLYCMHAMFLCSS
jgi:hypothetical protein